MIWQKCLSELQEELSANDFNLWIRPLQALINDDKITLFAPNKFVFDNVNEQFLDKLKDNLKKNNSHLKFEFKIGTATQLTTESKTKSENIKTEPNWKKSKKIQNTEYTPTLIKKYTFDSFVEGKSNQMANAASKQVAQNPGTYNPLFIYGSTGLGKTHLLHAIGNEILNNNKNAKIVYMHSERFVQDMVRALQNNEIDHFKSYYRSVDALMIDDIQFFANKERTQEEFFHTFNTLLEGNKQVILTSDKYPKEINGVEDRLKSRFSWGLTLEVEPPELETRVAILMKKAEDAKTYLAEDVAFFIAEKLRSNVRELEGALNRVIANATFTGSKIDIEFVKEALKDMLTLQEKLVTISNIQKTVAEYYKIKVSDLLSKRRTRTVARPRQLAMALAKELTNKSLPEIGNEFGGKDHTTVLHACKKISELKEDNIDIKEDYNNLIRTLTS